MLRARARIVEEKSTGQDKHFTEGLENCRNHHRCGAPSQGQDARGKGQQTRRLNRNCSISFSSLSAFVCYEAEVSTRHATNNISRASASLHALLKDFPDPGMGSLVGVQACLLRSVSPAYSGLLERHPIWTTYVVVSICVVFQDG